MIFFFQVIGKALDLHLCLWGYGLEHQEFRMQGRLNIGGLFCVPHQVVQGHMEQLRDLHLHIICGGTLPAFIHGDGIDRDRKLFRQVLLGHIPVFPQFTQSGTDHGQPLLSKIQQAVTWLSVSSKGIRAPQPAQGPGPGPFCRPG